MPPSRSIRPETSLLDAAYRVLDTAGLLAGLALSCWSLRLVLTDSLLWGAVGTLAFFVAAEFTGLYRNWRGVASEKELLCCWTTWLVTAGLVAIPWGLSISLGPMSHTQLLRWILITPLTLASFRILLRTGQDTLRTRGYNTRGLAIVGITELGIQLAQNIQQSPQLGYRLCGFYDDRLDERTPTLPTGLSEHVGALDELYEQARRGAVSCVYITLPMRAEARIKEVLNRLADSTASVYVVPDFFVFELLHSRWSNIGGLPVVSVFENPFYGVDGIVKRIVDVLLTLAILTVAALPMLVIALLVKCTSPGPVFFRQKRYGLDGREIRVWKYRSMRVCEDGQRVVQAQRNDSRITPLGAILRRTSLDELPQLFNVLEGTMSLVGPRPHATAHNEQFRELIQGYMLRHKVKPGITGLAQVSGWRGETDTLEKMEKRVECDHRYIREWSLWLDFEILLKTIWVVLSRKNAY